MTFHVIGWSLGDRSRDRDWLLPGSDSLEVLFCSECIDGEQLRRVEKWSKPVGAIFTGPNCIVVAEGLRIAGMIADC